MKAILKVILAIVAIEFLVCLLLPVTLCTTARLAGFQTDYSEAIRLWAGGVNSLFAILLCYFGVVAVIVWLIEP